jgi:hypothetical protein
MGEAQETLGDGAGVRPWCERRVVGRRQLFLVARRRIVSSIRARAPAMAIGPSRRRSRLAWSAGRGLLVCGQKFALDLK